MKDDTVLIGSMRASKSDGTQTLDLQYDALLRAGVPAERIYEDLASGRKDARPGLDAYLKALPCALAQQRPAARGETERVNRLLVHSYAWHASVK